MKRPGRKRELVIRISRSSLRPCRRTNEPIADSDHRLYTVATQAELLSQAANVNIQSSRVTVVAVSPNLIEQLLASDNSAALFCQDRQQLEFLVCKFHVCAFARRAHIGKVD